MMGAGQDNRQKIRYLAVLLLFLGISSVFLGMIWNFLLTVFMAAIFSGLSYPTYERLQRLFGGRKSLASGATLILVLLLIVTPLVFFTGIVVSQALSISESVTPWVGEFLNTPGDSEKLFEWIPFWDRLEPYREQITKKLGEVTGAIGSFLVDSLSAATRGTVDFFFQLFVMLYSMFFFLIHGRTILDDAMRLFPLPEQDKADLLDKFVSVSRATLKGSLVIGIIQGSLAGLAFYVAGIKGAAFWGTIMGILSILPGIGAPLIWVPAVIYLLAVGRIGPAIGLLLWCALVVGTVDNFLRPLLVGKDTKMPDLLVLLSTVGGISLFGAVGFVVGPVIAALFLAVYRIYGETFGDLLSAPPSVDGGGCEE
jgi:predicted PurR-regulated permease PerM